MGAAGLCGRRQLRNLIASGSGLFWEVDDKRIWLRSAVRVAQALGISNFHGQEVAIPLSVLTGGIGVDVSSLLTHVEPAGEGDPVARLAPTPLSAAQWFERGCALDADPTTQAEAIEAYRCALAADPRFADAHCNLGSVYYSQDRRECARRSFERALAANPRHLLPMKAAAHLVRTLREIHPDLSLPSPPTDA